jgi:hypothetical protein
LLLRFCLACFRSFSVSSLVDFFCALFCFTFFCFYLFCCLLLDPAVLLPCFGSFFALLPCLLLSFCCCAWPLKSPAAWRFARFFGALLLCFCLACFCFFLCASWPALRSWFLAFRKGCASVLLLLPGWLLLLLCDRRSASAFVLSLRFLACASVLVPAAFGLKFWPSALLFLVALRFFWN